MRTNRFRFAQIAAIASLYVVACLVLPARARAGDSLYGTVVDVASAVVVTFDYGAGKYDLRLAGIDPPTSPAFADGATSLLSRLVLQKKIRMRFEYRADDGTMLARLFTEDSGAGYQDVAVEMIRAGLAMPQDDYLKAYTTYASALAEAQKAHRGIWSTSTIKSD